MTTTNLLEKLLDGNDLSVAEATLMMNGFMEGELSNSQMAAILVALRLK